MEFSRTKIRQILFLMVIAALLILAVFRIDDILLTLKWGLGIAFPLIMGGAMAFVLNIPMRGIEKHLLKKWTGKKLSKLKRPVSICLTLLLIMLLLSAVVSLLVPQLVEAGGRFARRVPSAISALTDTMNGLNDKYPVLSGQAKALEALESNWMEIVQNVFSFARKGAVSILSSSIGIAGSVISVTVNGAIAFMFCLYVLAQKEMLGRQAHRLLFAYFPKRFSSGVMRVLTLLNKSFTSFITGQCLEAVIVGVLFVVSMTVFRMPYAIMIGVLIAFTALLPIVGYYIGLLFGVFIILMENPMQAVWFVVLFFVVQQLEGSLIYPRVVGNSVGLPAIWVFVAVTVGGSLFGVIGMLIFIPIVSTIYVLVRDDVRDRENTKMAGEEAKTWQKQTQ